MGETLILIPGLACTAHLFKLQVSALSADRKVVVADHRQDDSMAAIAARLLNDAPDRFALAGLSMGGYVAMEVMRQAPERVSRLALLDTTARPDTPETRQNRERQIALAESGHFEDIFTALWPKLVHPDRQSDKTLQEIIFGMMRETGPEAFVRQQHAIMGRADSRPLLPSIEIPTLILVGEGDLITPPEVAREMADLVEWSSLTVIPEAGHTSTLEQPEKVTQALHLWLEEG